MTDASGNATAKNKYSGYGAPDAGNLGRFQYTGQMWFAELGLHYYKARFYNPALGRFMQTDPIGYGDGMNLYAYVGNDPVNLKDPTGLFPAAFLPAGVFSEGFIDASDIALDASAANFAFSSFADTLPGFLAPAASGASASGLLGRALKFGSRLLRSGGPAAAFTCALACSGERGGDFPAFLKELFGLSSAALSQANAISAASGASAGFQTTAVLAASGPGGVDFRLLVAVSGDNRLSPEQLSVLSGFSSEVVNRSSGLHAEVKVLDQARLLGLHPLALGVSRPICPACVPVVNAHGGHLFTPQSAYFPPGGR